jgi:Protein of unknown function (DUF3307)
MVHSTLNLFLALYLAHLLADFVFQTDAIVAGKKDSRWQSYFVHGLTYYGTMLAIVLVMNPSLVGMWAFERVVVALCLVHLLLDWAKLTVTNARWIPDDVQSFTIDQAVHLTTVAAATLFITRPSLQSAVPYLQAIRSAQERILIVAVIYVVVIFGGGYFVRYLIGPLWKQKPNETTKEHDEVVNAGLYIGWLERFLALTAIFLQSPGTVGLILTAKSIARYPELKSTGRFVEYFLIGTLLSISIAIVGGVILLKIFYGTVTLGK